MCTRSWTSALISRVIVWPSSAPISIGPMTSPSSISISTPSCVGVDVGAGLSRVGWTFTVLPVVGVPPSVGGSSHCTMNSRLARIAAPSVERFHRGYGMCGSLFAGCRQTTEAARR
jgi:hypothetical protein